LLAGNNDIIKKCVRYRRMLGGAMRQVGIFAAGFVCSDNNIDRLAEDHHNAILIAEKFRQAVRFCLT
jgi:threonine aldolase